jgi:hypothetical protein
MSMHLGGNIVNKKYLGVIKLNKIMLGVIEIFPNLAEIVEPFTPADLFASNEQGGWWDFYDDMDTKIAFRRNLLTYSEGFTNAAWVKTGVTVASSAISHPLGRSVFSIVPTAVSQIPVINGVSAAVAANVGTAYRYYADLKAGTYTVGILAFQDRPNVYGGLAVDLLTGTVLESGGANATGITQATATPLGDGWYRLSFVHDGMGAIDASNALGINGAPSGLPSYIAYNSVSYTPDGVSGIYATAAQRELATQTAGTYQKVTDWNTEFLAQYPDHALYQDAGGMVPVTNIEQPIGLVLSKANGLELGTDTPITGYTNGGFSTFSVDANFVVTASHGSYCSCSTSNLKSVVKGKTYKVVVDVTSYSGAVVVMLGSSGGGSTYSTTGTLYKTGLNTFYLTVTQTGNLHVCFVAGSGGSIVLKTVLYKEVKGDHLHQATAAKRLALTARVNEQLYSEVFTNAAYRKTGVAFTASPVGTFSNGKTGMLMTNDGTATHYFDNYPTIYGNGAIPANYSIFFKRVTNSGSLRMADAPQGNGVSVDLATLALTNLGNGIGKLDDLGNGEYRLSVSVTRADFNYTVLALDNGVVSSASIHITGMQSSIGSALRTYQRVGTSSDYDYMGFPFAAKYDGTDDVVATPLSGGFTNQTILAGLYFPFGQTATRSLLYDYTGPGGIKTWYRNTPTATAYIYTAGGNAGPTFPVPATIVSMVGYDGTAIKGQINNNTVYSRNETLAPDTTAGFNVGAGNATEYFIGNLNQLVYLNRYLNTQEMADTKAFIAAKSGVTLV